MKQPGFIDGIVFAIGVSLAAGATTLVLTGLIADGSLSSLILLTAGLAYLLYLLRRSRVRVGRVVLLALWTAASLAGLFFDLPALEQVLLQAGFIWLTRALYFHGSLFSAALDFGLVAAGLAAGAWAMLSSGSLAAALWSFFLLQALFVWIPNSTRRQAEHIRRSANERSPFQSAHRVAIDAVRKLSQP